MKFLYILPALALIGAGCAASTSVNTTAETETPAPFSSEFPAPGNEDSSETTVTTDDGTTIVFEQKTETQVEADADIEDGVPVTDVVLGGATLKLDITSRNFAFTPNVIEAKAGEKIEVMFKENTGFHTFVIDEIDLKHAIKAGEALVFTAPKEPGTYPFYCDVGSHRAMGMEGKLIVK